MNETQTSPNIVALSESQTVSMTDEWYQYAQRGHFWIDWRFEVLRKILLEHAPELNDSDARALEIGCGHGVFREQVEEEIGITVDGCDLNMSALESIRRQGRGDIYLYDIFDSKASMLNRYSMVFLMDVIEHLDDDRKFLEKSIQHLKPEGFVVINVPALPICFSKYDEQAGHVRRYTKRSLSSLVESAGLQLVDCRYWGCTMVPILLVRKLYLSLYQQEGDIISKGFQPPSPFAHRILSLIKDFELLLPIPAPFGSSLIALAQVNR